MSNDYRDPRQTGDRVEPLGPMGTGTTPTPRHEKHIVLASAIDEIDSVIDSIQYLISRIEGNPTEQPIAPQTTPSLSFIEVLDKGSEAINSKCKAMKDQLANLETLLF